MLKRFKYEEMAINMIMAERMSDILSEGLSDGRDAAYCMAASGVTPEVLFGGNFNI